MYPSINFHRPTNSVEPHQAMTSASTQARKRYRGQEQERKGEDEGEGEGEGVGEVFFSEEEFWTATKEGRLKHTYILVQELLRHGILGAEDCATIFLQELEHRTPMLRMKELPTGPNVYLCLCGDSRNSDDPAPISDLWSECTEEQEEEETEQEEEQHPCGRLVSLDALRKKLARKEASDEAALVRRMREDPSGFITGMLLDESAPLKDTLEVRSFRFGGNRQHLARALAASQAVYDTLRGDEHCKSYDVRLFTYHVVWRGQKKRRIP